MTLETHTRAPATVRATRSRPTVSTTPATGAQQRKAATPEKPVGQIVLVLQGGGALGAYQAGVYQGLMEGGIEPDWVIGTSIGAINGALIAGNPPGRRVQRLQEFWGRLGGRRGFDAAWSAAFTGPLANLQTLTQGVAGFFEAQPGIPQFKVFVDVIHECEQDVLHGGIEAEGRGPEHGKIRHRRFADALSAFSFCAMPSSSHP